jgi:hypothetical protein
MSGYLRYLNEIRGWTDFYVPFLAVFWYCSVVSYDIVVVFIAIKCQKVPTLNLSGRSKRLWANNVTDIYL